MPRFIARNILRFVLPMALHCLQGTSLFAGVNCEVVKPHPPSEAEKAFLAADYAKAASEYQTALASHPGKTVFHLLQDHTVRVSWKDEVRATRN